MLVKMGVPYHNVSRHMRRAWLIIDQVFLQIVGREAILTSTTEGTHSVGSLHYDTVNYGASDFRARDLTLAERDDLKLAVKKALADRFGERQYDVLFSPEDGHPDACLHVEYDPK